MTGRRVKATWRERRRGIDHYVEIGTDLWLPIFDDASHSFAEDRSMSGRDTRALVLFCLGLATAFFAVVMLLAPGA